MTRPLLIREKSPYDTFQQWDAPTPVNFHGIQARLHTSATLVPTRVPTLTILLSPKDRKGCHCLAAYSLRASHDLSMTGYQTELPVSSSDLSHT
jgi:hypothetical protein